MEKKKKITVYLLIQFNSRTLYSCQGQFKRSMKVALKGSTCRRRKGHSSQTHVTQQLNTQVKCLV